MSEVENTGAAERGHVYALLATVFRCPLDAAQLDRLRSPTLVSAMQRAGIDPGEDFTSGDANAVLDRLAIDYTQLFHASADRVVAHEGLLDGKNPQLMGPIAHSIREFMAEAGYIVVPESGEVPDHISVELAFMSELAHREAEAAHEGDCQTAERAALLQRKFIKQHLGRWASAFAKNVQNAATTPFYRSMAALLAELIADEHDRSATQ